LIIMIKRTGPAFTLLPVVAALLAAGGGGDSPVSADAAAALHGRLPTGAGNSFRD
jgi:hypothetical protein